MFLKINLPKNVTENEMHVLNNRFKRITNKDISNAMIRLKMPPGKIKKENMDKLKNEVVRFLIKDERKKAKAKANNNIRYPGFFNINNLLKNIESNK